MAMAMLLDMLGRVIACFSIKAQGKEKNTISNHW